MPPSRRDDFKHLRLDFQDGFRFRMCPFACQAASVDLITPVLPYPTTMEYRYRTVSGVDTNGVKKSGC